MHFPRLASTVVLALAATACSDESSDPMTGNSTTTTNPNQPAANAGSSGSGAAGSGNMAAPTGNTGGSGSEGMPTPVLNPGGGMAMGGGNMNPPPAGMAGMANTPAPAAPDAGEPPAEDNAMSFFLTSRGSGNGGNFGGIAGADAFCEMLAVEADPANGNKTWRAYLSTSTENARDRIGTGPWRNAAGVIIGNSVEQLHDQTPGINMATGAASEATYPFNSINTALMENGMPLPAQPVLHDILTGSNLDGTVSATGTCNNWTSTTGMTTNGHSNRTGGGTNPSSWNSAHATGCGQNAAGTNFQQGTVSQGGGQGQIYCFAID